jgi:hypothetical protein
MNTELIKENDKIFEVNHDLLDPNGNPVIVELQDNTAPNFEENKS